MLLKDDGRQQFNILSGGELRNNVDLPLNDYDNGDRLFVYWAVPPGVAISGYHVGAAVQDFSLTVE